jgi:hypothetical protein
MIPEIDEAILSSLRKGLEGMVPAESIVPGMNHLKNGVCVSNTDFTIVESGMKVTEVRNEEKLEVFDGDGQLLEFKLTGEPVREILKVEHPHGRFRAAPDDFTFDRVKNTVVFREPPKKGKDSVAITYELDKPLGESHILKFALLYAIAVTADKAADRDKITLAAIEALYRDAGNLFLQGVDDIRFNRGYTIDAAEGDVKSSVLEYTITTSRRIDVTYPAITQVEIKKSKI